MKTCYQCKEAKEDHLFYPDSHSADGVTSACIECQKKRSKDYYSKKKNELTPEQKQARKGAYQKWKLNNPDKYKQLADKHNACR